METLDAEPLSVMKDLAARVDEPPAIPPLKKLESRYRKWLLLKDPNIITVAVSTVIANRLNGDPFWLFFVTAPSGLKTELINSLAGLDDVRLISDLTSQTFASGMKTKGPDPSLLAHLSYGTILGLKDLTTVLSMHRDRRQEILSQLREIYDGSYSKTWGTGKTLNWKGKLGLIAGVTTIIDTHYSIYQTLGERFIQYRVAQPNPEEVSLVAMRNQGRESAMRQELADAVVSFFETIDLDQEPEISEESLRKLAALSSLCVLARSGVIRGPYGNREIEYVPEPEAPPRLAKQLALFMKAAKICQLDEAKAYQLCLKLAFDSIHRARFAVIRLLSNHFGNMTTTEVSQRIGYPTNTARRYLEDLAALEVLEVTKQGPGKADEWSLSAQTLNLLINAGSEGFLRGVPLTSGE